MTKVAWVFPGQGSQAVGMGRDLFDNIKSARTVFEQADKALGFQFQSCASRGRKTSSARPSTRSRRL